MPFAHNGHPANGGGDKNRLVRGLHGRGLVRGLHGRGLVRGLHGRGLVCGLHGRGLVRGLHTTGTPTNGGRGTWLLVWAI